MDSNVAENINILAKFLGTRDIDALNQEELFKQYGIHQVDVMVLFGGSILEGGDVLASGIKNFVAKKYIIVGGAGHTTDTLRQVVHLEYPDIETTDLSEAEIFQKYIKHVYGCKADYLETKSTNCGNNITYLLRRWTKGYTIKQPNMDCQPTEITALMRHRAVFSWAEEGGIPTSGA